MFWQKERGRVCEIDPKDLLMKGHRKIGVIIYLALMALFLIAAPTIISIIFSESVSLSYLSGINVLFFFSIALTGLITVIEFASLFFDKDATWPTLIVAVGLLGSLFFSTEACYIYGIDQAYFPLFEIFHVLMYGVSIFGFSFFVAGSYKVILSKAEKAAFVIATSITIISFIPLRMLGYGHFPLFVAIAIALLFCLRSLASAYLNDSIDLVFILSSCIILSSTTNVIVDALHQAGFCPNPDFGMASLLASFAVLCFFFIYLVYVIKAAKTASSNEQFKANIESLQASILKRQISPHFLFNSLNMIKTSYRVSPKKGERGLDLLSRYLRYNVESDDVFLIPFTKEVENISYFVELANLAQEKKFQVIYNIDCADFLVPTLSLQPFVENAIRYSKVNEREDGAIEIDTEEIDDNIVIRIIDNGVGFEQAPSTGKHYGIPNVTERFRLLLNATVKVESKLDVGTTVTIVIPKREKGVEDENRSRG